jgi:hypothetical protein
LRLVSGYRIQAFFNPANSLNAVLFAPGALEFEWREESDL